MDLGLVEFVLLRPARAANVAAACRALKNMGIERLCLVKPPPGLDRSEARSLAYGAWDTLDGARRAASLAEAVAGSTLVVATTGRGVAGAWNPRRLAEELPARARGGRASIVFGPEATGLGREELDVCHELVHVPTDPRQPSLNLAQAVLLVAYELRTAALGADAERARAAHGPRRAPAGEIEQAVQQLRTALLDVGYLDPANPGRILTELRRLLARAGPTRRELLLLRGLARQVSWAGRVARRLAGKG